MTKKKKQKTANFIMVLIIVIIAAAGITAAGFILGWFGGKAGSACLLDVNGLVYLTRSGVSFEVEQDTDLRAGDVMESKSGGSANIRIGEQSVLTLGPNSVLEITNEKSSGFASRIDHGELFAFVMNGADPVRFTFDDREVTVKDAIVSFSVQNGADTLNVFSGETAEASAGETVQWVNGEREKLSLQAESLNAFDIAQIRGINAVRQTCFSDQELDDLEAARAAAKQEAAQTVMLDEESKDLDHRCTITVVCDTILDHMDMLDPAKAEFVPEDGVILPVTEVPFAEGETVFDVLQRVCGAYDMQLEYSWTPLYDAYYIEGINHLYEFDCGSESGWMFKVNGWFPNYGCSAYQLEEGDAIVWCYTCVGLGVDVGGIGY